MYHLKYHFDAIESFDKAIKMEETATQEVLSEADVAAVREHLPERYTPPEDILGRLDVLFASFLISRLYIEHSWLFRGYACFDLRELDEALRCFQKASEVNPDNTDALMRQSQVL